MSNDDILAELDFETIKTDEELVREMDWTTLEDSCLDPTLTPSGDVRQCRRSRGHTWRNDPEHASGRGSKLVRWRS